MHLRDNEYMRAYACNSMILKLCLNMGKCAIKNIIKRGLGEFHGQKIHSGTVFNEVCGIS